MHDSHIIILDPAAIPPTFTEDPVFVTVFRDTNLAQLICPIQLGNLHSILTPYDISWEKVRRFPVPVTDRSLLSNDNTVLSVPLPNTSPETYRCKLRLTRCDIMNRCLARMYLGPPMQINVIGKMSPDIL